MLAVNYFNCSFRVASYLLNIDVRIVLDNFNAVRQLSGVADNEMIIEFVLCLCYMWDVLFLCYSQN